MIRVTFELSPGGDSGRARTIGLLDGRTWDELPGVGE